MTTVVPSLSSRGWASELSDKADLLLSYYFTSDYLQSVAWNGTIASFQYLLEQHHHEPLKFKARLKDDLEIYLGRYFDGVQVTTQVSAQDTNTPNELTTTIDVKVQENETVYSLGREIQSKDSLIERIFEINNG